MVLSKRLGAVANFVDVGEHVADIGTDHGYIPMYLIRSDISPKVYAMDVNEGPYQIAKRHIEQEGLSNQIEVRLSDGMKELHVGEATTIIIAGMGGGLTCRLLEQDRRLWDSLNYLILQPQSEIVKVREFLLLNGWRIIDEDIVLDEGKIYPILKCQHGQESEYSSTELLYGRRLIEKKHPILLELVKKNIEQKESVRDFLKGKPGKHIEMRLAEFKKELEMDYEVLRHYQ